MLGTLLVILAVWFFGSIPLALIVGRLLRAKERTVVIETLEISQPEPLELSA